MTIKVEGSVGAKCCGELRDIYCRMGELREVLAQMHGDYVDRGSAPSFDRVEEAHLMMTGLFDELERYILPIVGPDSVYRTEGDEQPVCPL